MHLLKRAVVGAWVLAFIASKIWAQGSPPVTVALNPIRVSEHAYYVEGQPGLVSRDNQGFNSNAGFVVTEEGVVVFDALGSPSLGEALIEKIRGITQRPIKRVIISHYHADHVYGVQAFKEIGVEVWAHGLAQGYLATEAPTARLAERRRSLAPWVNEATRIVPADLWLDADATFKLGGLTFRVYHVGPAHTPEDLALLVEEEGVLFAGDLMFAGRIPFIGNADSRAWLAAIGKVIGYQPKTLIGGHGPASNRAAQDLALTRVYLLYLRKVMGEAVENFIPFEDVYERTDWSRFSHLPAFEAANRGNAYNTYLLMERESLDRENK